MKPLKYYIPLPIRLWWVDMSIDIEFWFKGLVQPLIRFIITVKIAWRSSQPQHHNKKFYTATRFYHHYWHIHLLQHQRLLRNLQRENAIQTARVADQLGIPQHTLRAFLEDE